MEKLNQTLFWFKSFIRFGFLPDSNDCQLLIGFVDWNCKTQTINYKLVL